MAKPHTIFAVSERVNHALYGPGTIAEVAQPYTVIDFDKSGRRKFVISMVQLEPTTIMAPTPPATKSRSRSAKTAKAKK